MKSFCRGLRADVSMEAAKCALCPDLKVLHSFVCTERLKAAKALVDEAVKMHKIFSVQGSYPVIRAALRARGWVEQCKNCSKKQNCQCCHKSRARLNDAGNSYDEDGEKEQDLDRLHDIMSCLVKKEMVYFYWTNCRGAVNANSLHKEQMTNHFANTSSFTTKVGLCMSLRNLHWFDSTDPDSFFPRCYVLGAHEKQDFIDDFRRTACTSLLKYIVERHQGDVKGKTISNMRKPKKQQSRPLVLSQMIKNVLKVCQQFVDSLEHRDIDIDSETPLTQEEWTEFIDIYYLVVHDGAEIEISDDFVTCCKAMLHRLQEVSPQLDIDGIHNIWIVKPAAKSRGRDIKCSKRLDKILRLVDSRPAYFKSKWVVQKYLERPLLVHGTKFDVRQWFLVTDWNHLTVWFYKKCYLRFSTQPFSLDTLDSSVHLCNNSIQKHLRPSQQRHRDIPAYNMWSDKQFRTFLCSQSQEAQWETVAVQGMKRTVIQAAQTAQDKMDSRKNTFELYGADFMFGHDLHPWLLEINASPDMAPSTPVTAHLCAAVQEDTLKVVLDWRVDHTANTGDFELIYKQAAVKVPQYLGSNLLVKGCAIKSPCPLPALRSSNCSTPKHQNPIRKNPAAENVKHLPNVPLKSAETPLKNSSSEVLQLPPPPFHPGSLMPTEPLTDHQPLTVNKCVHLPLSHRSVVLYSKSAEDKQQDLSTPLEITAPEQSRQAATSPIKIFQ
uniref:Tubulin tyrosine ligase-like family, member 3 n=1 Tax=Amphiprion ocellaris TaxID=80972 RepID=A0AAQ5XEU1_AMPOC